MQDPTSIAKFANPSYDPNQEVIDFFTNQPSEQYISHSIQADQMQYNLEVSLKESVFSHYTEFIEFSLEVQKLEESMESLKKNMIKTNDVIESLKDTTIIQERDITELQVKKFFAIPEHFAWLKNVGDDIDNFIYQRRFSEAVDICIKAQLSLKSIKMKKDDPLLDVALQISEKSEMLASRLHDELLSPNLNRSERRRYCRLLGGLGRDDQARLLFLQLASDEIMSHKRRVKACGDIPAIVNDLAIQFFECVQDTGSNFSLLFGREDHNITAIFFSWAVAEVNRFIDQVIVYALGEGGAESVQSAEEFETFAGCISPILIGAGALERAGFQLDCFIVQQIGSRIATVVTNYLKLVMTEVQSLPPPSSQFVKTSFKTQSGSEQRSLTHHCAGFYRAIHSFIHSAPQLLTNQVLPFIEGPINLGFKQIFEIEAKSYEKWAAEKDVKKSLAMFVDLYFLTIEFLPTVERLFYEGLAQFFPTLDENMSNTKTILKQITNQQLQDYCIYQITHIMKFSPETYVTINESAESPHPTIVLSTQQVIALLKQAEQHMPTQSFNMIKKAMFTVLFSVISNDPRWESVANTKISDDGFSHFVLDLTFIFTASTVPSLSKVLDAIIQKVCLYTNGAPPPSSKWIQKRMMETLKDCKM